MRVHDGNDFDVSPDAIGNNVGNVCRHDFASAFDTADPPRAGQVCE